jgi:hypothetical protein
VQHAWEEIEMIKKIGVENIKGRHKFGCLSVNEKII